MIRTRRNKDVPIDWDEARRRLARAQAAAAATHSPSPERARAILEERARSLARPLPEAKARGEVLELLTFGLGRERYAIETRFVREVTRLSDLTPVPGAPSFILGITNVRGEVVPVVDVRKLFGVAEKGLTDLSRLVVLGTEATEFGLLADAVHDVERLPGSEALDAPESVAGIGREYLRAVTRDALVVLDGEALLEDERLVVGEPESAPRA
jgi:purine-binding chemotaxis protein CheW